MQLKCTLTLVSNDTWECLSWMDTNALLIKRRTLLKYIEFKLSYQTVISLNKKKLQHIQKENLHSLTDEICKCQQKNTILTCYRVPEDKINEWHTLMNFIIISMMEIPSYLKRNIIFDLIKWRAIAWLTISGNQICSDGTYNSVTPPYSEGSHFSL